VAAMGATARTQFSILDDPPSVTVEAYRHLVDPFADSGMTGDMLRRVGCFVVKLSVTEILDLRSEAAQRASDFLGMILCPELARTRLGQNVGRVAHHSGFTASLSLRRAIYGETSRFV